jgi:hypothetical protein
MKMETICSSETSVDTQRTTWRHIPEDCTLQTTVCGNVPCQGFEMSEYRDMTRCLLFIRARDGEVAASGRFTVWPHDSGERVSTYTSYSDVADITNVTSETKN